MKIYRNLWRACLVASTALAIGSTGCSSVTPPSEAMPGEFAGAPDWVVQGCRGSGEAKNGDALCGVGSIGGTRNIALARTAAVGRGRTEIARTLQVKVKAMLKDYQATTTGGAGFGNEMNDEQHLEDVSKQITQLSLSGTEMRDTWISQTGTVYALVVLDVEKFENQISSMNQLSEQVRLAVQTRARRAFQELDEET